MAAVVRLPPEDERSRGVAPRPATNTLTGADDTPGAYQPGDSPPRRPCRICRRGTRPLVEIGSSHGWDVCWRCYGGYSNVRRHSAEQAVEAWELRIAEVLAGAEGMAS
jgi:hypothetical protein